MLYLYEIQEVLSADCLKLHLTDSRGELITVSQTVSGGLVYLQYT